MFIRELCLLREQALDLSGRAPTLALGPPSRIKVTAVLRKRVCDVSESLRTGREVSLDCFAPILVVKVSWVDYRPVLGLLPPQTPVCSFPHTALARGGLVSPDFSCEMNLMNLIHSLLLKTHPTILISCFLAQPKGSGCVREGLLPTVSATCSLVTFAQVGGPTAGKVVALSSSPAFLSPSYSPGVQKAPLLPSRQPLPVPGTDGRCV